jgi:nitroreductase
MDIMQAMEERHSVRSYRDDPIPEDILEELRSAIAERNEAGGLNIQLVLGEPEAFSGILARGFKGVRNYLALVGGKAEDLDERVGYHGQHLALMAQQLGLNTCWVAGATCRRSRCGAEVGEGEKIVCFMALGYGVDGGRPHRNKPLESLCRTDTEMPEWFLNGMRAAMLAPTARNQQKFMIALEDGKVRAESTGGFYSHVDLGIVRCHFELGAGVGSFEWA